MKDKLIESLKKADVLKKEHLDKAISIQQRKGGNLGKILVGLGYISYDDLMIFLSQQLNIPPIKLAKYKIDHDLIKFIPEKIARQYKLIPISKLANRLTVAMADPTNIMAMDDIKELTHFFIDIVIASQQDIENAITQYYGVTSEADISKIIKEGESVGDIEVIDEEDQIDISEITVESKKAPIVKVVSMILNEALNKRASDIHIEPQERSLRVRYRVDGQLQEALNLPKSNQNAIIARVKIMSRLDITETRLPQDGRFKIKFKDRDVDFRVSVLPIAFGNKIVLRALDRSSLEIGLEKLGFLPEPLEKFKTALKRPYGMILITGPTGSGKSTTLYSILNKLNTPDRNIVTIEDPVEYQLEGITQVQAKPEIGLTFANGLKSLLRQSPDIVMVGEIRDFETADVAIKASLTGQLVFSTLHTNDAPSAVTRLIDMGVEPFLIASSVIMTAAQRLCRKICPYCKKEVQIPKVALERIDKSLAERSKKLKFYAGSGCRRCNDTGYLGRMGTLETFIVDDNIRKLILERTSADKIKNYAISKGMGTMRENALKKFEMGLTTLGEVLRITSED
ncbi:MAG: Flp pilus assembly complex ATPase component TadA [Candidatus Omnitrophica bacterium]|nr:Flp pilus assembly complex ATPase component TadA [Candidatus Omnitrophota bacterium]